MARDLYVLIWVRDFFEGFARLIPKKRKGVVPDPITVVEICGKLVKCGVDDINEALDCTTTP